MSTRKRKALGEEAVDDNGKSRATSPRKKSRLSSLAGLDRNENNVKPHVMGHDGHRPHPAPLQLSNPFSPNSFPYSGPAKDFDVSPGLRDAIPPGLDVMPFWKPEQAAFINSAAGLDDVTWVGKRPLGTGSFGTAGLWERRDEDNSILEQIVVKESKAVPVEDWTGEVPEEVKMMRRLNKTDCRAVPKLIAYKRYNHVRKHRIYMEFCHYSDLATLNLNYKRFRTYFPEPFLWHTFNNLVKVAAAMQFGPADTDWGYQIIHRDLKPANIFLALEDEYCGFQSYPFAKTGDWGLATKIEHNDRRNPVGFRGTGTAEYLAPEQRQDLSSVKVLKAQLARHLDGSSPLRKLAAHTNIWGIGAIMFELLTHEAVDLYSAEEEWTVNGAFIEIPNARKPRYSSALTELIKLCLVPEPRDRPSVKELELKIGARCQSIVKKYDSDPSLRKRERLYYKGSEINQMPPGNLNYWHPVLGHVPHPSSPPGSQEIMNPFTNALSYPPFPSSELDDSEEEVKAVESGDHTVHENDGRGGKNRRASNGPRVAGLGKLAKTFEDPVNTIRRDSDGGPTINYINQNSVSNQSSRCEQSSSSETGSNQSDDSAVRRRVAMKKLPDT